MSDNTINRSKIPAKKKLCKIKDHENNAYKWLSFDDAISLVYPTIFDELNDAIHMLKGSTIEKGTDSKGRMRFSTVFMLKFIKSKNQELFLKTRDTSKKGFSGEVIKDAETNGKPRIFTQRLFNNLSKYKGNRNIDIQFLNDKTEDIKVYDSYRLYYGQFMFSDFITNSFLKENNITKNELKYMLYGMNFGYWTRGDSYSFYSVNSSLTALSDKLKADGYIEVAKQSDTDDYKKKYMLTVYRLTGKGRKLMEKYMDNMMFKRKVKFTEISNTKSFTKYSLVYNINKNRAVYFRAYALYSHMFEYINKNDIENPLSYNQEEIDLAMGESTREYKFSAFMYLTLNQLYKIGKVKRSTVAMIKNFLAKDVFADSGYDYVYSRKKRKKILEQPEDENYQSYDHLDEMFGKDGNAVNKDDELFTN